MIRLVNDIALADCVTHSGTMHADEVFATAFLEMLKGNINVCRVTALEGFVDSDTIVYDIGGGEYDHHQVDAKKRDNGITYSSFGLLWEKFGKELLKDRGYSNVEEIFLAFDKDLVEGIDGDDNGIFPKIDCKYRVKTLSNIIKLFNPSFESSQNESEQFLKAVDFAKIIIEEEILYLNGKVQAEKQVNQILDSYSDEHDYLILKEFLPYEETLVCHEFGKKINFVVFPSNRGGYVVKTVPTSMEDKTPKVLFPEEWAGLNGDDLEKVSQIYGLRFCHSGRFIVNCATMDSVYEVLNVVCKVK